MMICHFGFNKKLARTHVIACFYVNKFSDLLVNCVILKVGNHSIDSGFLGLLLIPIIFGKVFNLFLDNAHFGDWNDFDA